MKRLCQVPEAARAARERADAVPAERIRAVHTEWDGTYGRPRTTAELRDESEPVNHKRVGRVIRTHGTAGLRLRHVTTALEPSATPVPDLFRRDVTASAPNMKYVGDITYLPVGDGEFPHPATSSAPQPATGGSGAGRPEGAVVGFAGQVWNGPCRR